MPDGRPGDNPLTDIVVHGEEVFDAETNAAIRRICNGAPPQILELLGSLVMFWPLAENAGSPWDGMAKPANFKHFVAAVERCWRGLEASR